MLFTAIAALHLFFSFGKRVEQFPLFTYEGIYAAVVQTVKLWTWLQTAFLLKKFHFNRLFMLVLSKIFHKHGSTLSAGLIALEYFPVTVENAGKRASVSLKAVFSNPSKWALSAVNSTIQDSINEICKDGSTKFNPKVCTEQLTNSEADMHQSL